MDWSEYRIIARADQKFFPYGNSYISYSHTPLLIVLIVPLHSYLFSICPVCSDRSCYLFACICLMSCIYMMSGAKSSDFAAFGLFSLCCLRGSAAAFSSPGTVCSLPCSRSPPAACPQRISEPQWHDPSGQDFL